MVYNHRIASKGFEPVVANFQNVIRDSKGIIDNLNRIFVFLFITACKLKTNWNGELHSFIEGLRRFSIISVFTQKFPNII
jgi:hypothetical protein